jgi:FixJ family two-component response regulator
MSGIELQRHLEARSCKLPVIFITAHGYDKISKTAILSDWTVAKLTKPFSEDELLDAVHAALNWKPSASKTQEVP